MRVVRGSAKTGVLFLVVNNSQRPIKITYLLQYFSVVEFFNSIDEILHLELDDRAY